MTIPTHDTHPVPLASAAVLAVLGALASAGCDMNFVTPGQNQDLLTKTASVTLVTSHPSQTILLNQKEVDLLLRNMAVATTTGLEPVPTCRLCQWLDDPEWCEFRFHDANDELIGNRAIICFGPPFQIELPPAIDLTVDPSGIREFAFELSDADAIAFGRIIGVICRVTEEEVEESVACFEGHCREDQTVSGSEDVIDRPNANGE